MLKPFRELLIMEHMHHAHETGIPPMRPLFVDFPADPVCYQLEDEYMFGSDLLVAPVAEAGARSRQVYLPAPSKWKNAWTDELLEGGQWISAEAPLDRIPLFLRGDAQLPIREAQG